MNDRLEGENGTANRTGVGAANWGFNKLLTDRGIQMAGNVLEITDDNFQTTVLDSPQPVLVDFWAPWCGPCKMIAPAIEELANDYAGRVKVGKLNTDDNPKMASSLGVSAIPTVMLFKGGQIVERFVGMQPKARMSAAINNHL